MKDMLGLDLHLHDYILFPYGKRLLKGRLYSFNGDTVTIQVDKDRYIIKADNCVVYNSIVSVNPHLY